MQSFRRASILFLLAIGGLMSAPAAARADDKDILQMIPADAWGYVYIPSIGGLNDGIMTMQTEVMGMAMMDAVQFATMQLGIEKGLDNKGAAALIMLDMKKKYDSPKAEPAKEKKKDKDDDDDDDASEHAGSSAPPFVLILPASDTKELLANFSPAKEEDGIAKCEVHGETSYAHVAGKYVMLSPHHGAIKAVLDSKGSVGSDMTPARKKLLSDRSITISVAVHRVMDGYKDDITSGLGMLTAAMGPDGSVARKQFDKVLKMGRELAWLDISLGLDKAGIALTGVVTAKPGTEAASTLRNKQVASGSLLKGLADDQYVLALGAVGSKDKAADSDMQSMIDSLVNNPQFKSKMDPEKFKAFVKKAQSLEGLAGNVGIVISSLSDGPGGIVSASLVISTTNSERLMDGLSSLLLMLKDLPASEADRAKLAKMVKHTSGAETVGSAKVDHIAINVSEGDEIPEEGMAMIKKVVGSDGLLLRLAAADDKHVVLSLGGGKDHFAHVVDAAKKGDTKLAMEAGIQKASEKLPMGRTFEMYVSAESVMKLINRIARAHGEDAPIGKVPTIDTPVSMVVSANDGAGRFDFVVPMQVIKGVKQAVTEAQMGAHRKARMGDKGKKDSDEDDEDKDHGKDNDKSKDDDGE